MGAHARLSVGRRDMLVGGVWRLPRGAAVGACQELPPVLRMGFNSDASDHPQLYQVMQSVDLDFVQAKEEMGCIGTLDLLKVFRSGGIEW